MEQIIPIIIAAIVFGFQAYSNYQKEQEKARKRNPGQPRLPAVEEPRPQEPPAAPFDWLEELMGEPRPQQTPASVPQRPAEVPVIREETAAGNDIRSSFQSYSGTVSEEEFHRKRRERQQNRNQQKSEPVLSVQLLDEETTGNNREFDLRDAVIKAAILERPYTY